MGDLKKLNKKQLKWHYRRFQRMEVSLHNRMVAMGRLMSDIHYGNKIMPKCCICGEDVWQYPVPTYWLEWYGPHVYTLVDGRPVCSDKHAEEYFSTVVDKPGTQLDLFSNHQKSLY